MIRVNDKWDVDWSQGMTVKGVLDSCGFSHHYLVVSVNGKLVPPGEYASHPVADDDQVRAVHVIGGG